MKDVSFRIEPLKRARQEQGLSFTKVAAAVDMTENYIRQIESGRRRLTEKLAFKMSKLLNVPMTQIMVEPKRRRSA